MFHCFFYFFFCQFLDCKGNNNLEIDKVFYLYSDIKQTVAVEMVSFSAATVVIDIALAERVAEVKLHLNPQHGDVVALFAVAHKCGDVVPDVVALFGHRHPHRFDDGFFEAFGRVTLALVVVLVADAV